MLAIAGGKGGVGKTTTALGLSAALDPPVVAADADPDMPNLHALADVDREPTLAALGERTVSDLVQPHPRESTVGILPAPRIGDADAAADALARALDTLGATERPVVVDCPGGAGPDAAAPLRVADAALVVTTPCAPALRDAAKTAAMARTLDTPVCGAVLTRTRAEPAAVSDLLDCPLAASIPRADPPVLGDDGVREAYARLARRLGEDLL
jgi:septum site-determining protein MinD